MKRAYVIAAVVPCSFLMASAAFAQRAPSPILYYEPIDVEIVYGSGVDSAIQPAATGS